MYDVMGKRETPTNIHNVEGCLPQAACCADQNTAKGGAGGGAYAEQAIKIGIRINRSTKKANLQVVSGNIRKNRGVVVSDCRTHRTFGVELKNRNGGAEVCPNNKNSSGQRLKAADWLTGGAGLGGCLWTQVHVQCSSQYTALITSTAHVYTYMYCSLRYKEDEVVANSFVPVRL